MERGYQKTTTAVIEYQFSKEGEEVLNKKNQFLQTTSRSQVLFCQVKLKGGGTIISKIEEKTTKKVKLKKK